MISLLKLCLAGSALSVAADAMRLSTEDRARYIAKGCMQLMGANPGLPQGSPLNAECRGFMEHLQAGKEPQDALDAVKEGAYAAKPDTPVEKQAAKLEKENAPFVETLPTTTPAPTAVETPTASSSATSSGGDDGKRNWRDVVRDGAKKVGAKAKSSKAGKAVSKGKNALKKAASKGKNALKKAASKAKAGASKAKNALKGASNKLKARLGGGRKRR